MILRSSLRVVGKLSRNSSYTVFSFYMDMYSRERDLVSTMQEMSSSLTLKVRILRNFKILVFSF